MFHYLGLDAKSTIFVPILPFLGIGLSALCIFLEEPYLKNQVLSSLLSVVLPCCIRVFNQRNIEEPIIKKAIGRMLLLKIRSERKMNTSLSRCRFLGKYMKKYVAFVIEHLPPKGTLVCTEIGILGWAT